MIGGLRPTILRDWGEERVGNAGRVRGRVLHQNRLRYAGA